LENSFSSKVWSPSGVPTIYKIINEIDKHHTARFIFTAKDSGSGCFSKWNESNDKEIIVSGLRHKVCVISGADFFPSWIGRRARVALREIRQLFVIAIEIIKFKPDLIYCDHANVIVGGIFSRLQRRVPVVFRVMGVDGFMRQCLRPRGFMQRLYKWSYRSPFNLVLSTQDGSGVEMWMKSALRSTVKRKILLNGVDNIYSSTIRDERLLRIPNNRIVVLFVGKLEKYKGCHEFVQSIIILLNKNQVGHIHSLIIGTGNEEKKLKALVSSNNLNSYFTFIDALPHSQILSAHSISDIYVSLNYFGNLSNANLEAIQSNNCIVMPDSQPNIGVDVVTNNLLKKSIVTVPIKNPLILSDVLYNLIKSKKNREKMSSSIKKVKKDFLWTWGERIDKEMDLLKKISSVSS